MKQKLDELTLISGSTIRVFVFRVITALGVLGTVFGLIIAYQTGTGSSGDMQAILGMMPFVFLGIIYPINIYTPHYFQKTTYYMIPLKEIFKYNLKEYFNGKVVITYLGIFLLYDILLTIFFDAELLAQFLPILSGVLISPLFISLGFMITTITTKYYKLKRFILYILTYILVVISIILVNTLNIYILVTVFLTVGILSTYLMGLLMNKRERKMEV